MKVNRLAAHYQSIATIDGGSEGRGQSNSEAPHPPLSLLPLGFNRSTSVWNPPSTSGSCRSHFCELQPACPERIQLLA